MASVGPNYATACVEDASIGTNAWTNPGNATSSNNSYATANTYTTTRCLKATGFGFSIPTGATIDGIVVEWERKENFAGYTSDNAIRIVKGGTIQSQDKSSAATYGASDAWASYGGSTDTWGVSWTAEDINSSSFGAALSAKSQSYGAAAASVDACRITVYYTAPILLAADVSVTATATGELTTAIRMAGSASASPDASGSLTTAISLSGAASAVASAELNTSIRLVADVSAIPSASGDLTTAIRCAAQAAASPSASGDLTTAIRLHGSASASPQVSGSLTTAINLEANAQSTAAASGSLTTAIRLAGSVAASPSASATLTIRYPRYLTQQETIFLAEIEAYDPDTSSVVTYRYSSGRGFDNAGVFYQPRIENPATIRREISLGSEASSSYGELTLVNTDGGCNALAGDYCDGRTLTLKVGLQGDVYSSFQTVLVATITDVTVERERVSVRIRDNGAALDKPFSTIQYAGTNALPLGIEGTPDDIKGQYKPRIFGRISLMKPILVNTSKLIYQINNGAVDAVVNVFDAGAYLSAGSAYSSQSDMETNQPSPGTYRVWTAGGCFRLGSSSFGEVSCCVAEKWTYTSISAAGIIQRVLTEAGFTSGQYVASDFTALNAKTCGPLGVVVENGETIASIISRICETVGAWWGFDSLNRFRVGRLDAPSASPSATITDDHLISIERVERDTMPAWKVTLDADKNYAVQDKKNMAGIVPTSRSGWFSTESRPQKAEDGAVLVQRLLAEDVKQDGLFASISQAQAEATRRLNLNAARRDSVAISVPIQSEVFAAIEIGNTVKIETPRLGYDTGRNMVVTGISPDYKSGVCDVMLWG